MSFIFPHLHYFSSLFNFQATIFVAPINSQQNTNILSQPFSKLLGGHNVDSPLVFKLFVFIVSILSQSFSKLLGGHKWTRTTDLTLIRRAL